MKKPSPKKKRTRRWKLGVYRWELYTIQPDGERVWHGLEGVDDGGLGDGGGDVNHAMNYVKRWTCKAQSDAYHRLPHAWTPEEALKLTHEIAKAKVAELRAKGHVITGYVIYDGEWQHTDERGDNGQWHEVNGEFVEVGGADFDSGPLE